MKRECIKVYPVRFSVRTPGHGFPIDMLRYDCCRPATERDANPIVNALVNGASVTVELVAYALNPRWLPTTARWESFGCRDVRLAADDPLARLS